MEQGDNNYIIWRKEIGKKGYVGLLLFQLSFAQHAIPQNMIIILHSTVDM